jgi:prephenate dehydrogenase
MKPFLQIAIIGVGLLGGSLARVCKKKKLVNTVIGFGRHSEKLKKAQELGIIDSYATDLQTAVEHADLVVLCTPVSKLGPLAGEMAPFLKPGCIVTDVGSVKKTVVGDIQSQLPGSVHFVGSHPIAGGEKSGFEASTVDLFEQQKCIITPTSKTNASALARVKELWEQTGMHVISLDVEEHDIIFGAVSHLPHIIAYSLMKTVGEVSTKNYAEVTSFSGAGLKDITRIASSDPVMWRDICLGNKKPILNLIDKFQTTLQQMRNTLENEDGQLLEQTFQTANKYRSNLTVKNK